MYNIIIKYSNMVMFNYIQKCELAPFFFPLLSLFTIIMKNIIKKCILFPDNLYNNSPLIY